MYKLATAAVSFVMLSAITGTDVTTHTTTSYSKPSKLETAQIATRPAPTAPVAPVTPPPVTVTVQPGDTLSAIAAAQGTTYIRIFDANDVITDPNTINVGQQLRIPDASEQLPDRAVPAAAPDPAASTSAPATRAVTVSVSIPVVGNDAKAFIYSRESGNNPNATSPSGCYGLGQDCNGVVRTRCGADYACQDAYFTNYAVNRYGSWAGAASFWQANGWW